MSSGQAQVNTEFQEQAINSFFIYLRSKLFPHVEKVN